VTLLWLIAKMRPSCPLVPVRMGTLAMLPVARAASTNSSCVMLSLTGRKARASSSARAFIVFTFAARAQESISELFPLQFSFDMSVSQADVLEFSSLYEVAWPLCMIAARNGGLSGMVVMRSSTERAPADSPKIVTLVGSPPKAWMFL